MQNHTNISNTIWNIANLLRGGWKAYEYQDVVLPFVVLKRLDAALLPTKQKVLERFNELDGTVNDLGILRRVAKHQFYNSSPYTLDTLLDDQTHIARNLRNYINGFSENVRDIFKKFEFDKQLDRLKDGDLLYRVIQEFNKLDLDPERVTNYEIGLAFEDLIRRFAEQSNETAGEHYTPRDVVRLMAQLLFAGEEQELAQRGVAKTLYDPACGTGGMLTIGKEYVQDLNENADIWLFGQELNPQTYAVCKADLLLKGEDPELIKGGEKEHSKASTLSNDQHANQKFDYILCNPPYGFEWKKDERLVKREVERGMSGRFGAGLPAISDGQFLFLQHIISKFRPKDEGGSDAVVITNGSPLFTGDAGSGPSEIRRWMMAQDYIDTIIALPESLFFNTGIPTYIWVLTNRKPKEKEGKLQLIDARMCKTQRRKNLGEKRYDVSEEDADEIKRLYMRAIHNGRSKVLDTAAFGYRAVTTQRPLRLRFEVTNESLGRLKENKTFANDKPSRKRGEAGKKENTDWQKLRTDIYNVLESMRGKVWMDRAVFLEALESKCAEIELKVAKRYRDIVWKEIGEKDESAEICLDKDGNPEPDKDLKDVERVPLGKDIYEYFDEEVKPYTPDAWIDEAVCDEKDGEVGKVGYEIPFTRFFYKYEAPRAIEEIEKEIKGIEKEIDDLLEQV